MYFDFTKTYVSTIKVKVLFILPFLPVGFFALIFCLSFFHGGLFSSLNAYTVVGIGPVFADYTIAGDGLISAGWVLCFTKKLKEALTLLTAYTCSGLCTVSKKYFWMNPDLLLLLPTNSIWLFCKRRHFFITTIFFLPVIQLPLFAYVRTVIAFVFDNKSISIIGAFFSCNIGYSILYAFFARCISRLIGILRYVIILYGSKTSYVFLNAFKSEILLITVLSFLQNTQLLYY